MKSFFKLSDLRNGAKFEFVDKANFSSVPCVKKYYDYKSRLTLIEFCTSQGDSVEFTVSSDPFVQPA